MQTIPLGALPHEGGFLFRVWAPHADAAALVLEDRDEERPMTAESGGYFTLPLSEATPGLRYRYRLDAGDAYPDPASRYQPEGVHGPSLVVDPDAYAWGDAAWSGVAQRDLVFYELHVGTFTPEGTLRAAQDRLPYLRDLGVTAVELMPLADFPGRWNWGYDHAALYAPSRTYGTPDDLRAFVDAAHGHGLAVFFDVIYNHLGPDGAYVAAYAPMFTDRHHTPWGQAMNLDDLHSDGVRNFFLDNALHWLREYHADGLRLDATHALIDDSDEHFLATLARTVEGLGGMRRYLFAEDHRNLAALVRPRAEGGYGLDGVWADDFHHLVRHQLAGDDEAYYADFAGTTAADLAVTLRQGWFFTGQLAPHLGEARGTPPEDVRPDQCVICIQNHDQVGNRPTGDRLSEDISLPAYRAASALLLLAPQLPLLFMGQEWAATTPFQFFTDHNDELGRLVTAGRKREFEHFSGFQGEVPDPQDEQTFLRSRLDWSETDQAPPARMRHLYRDLLRLRRRMGGAVEADDVQAHGPRALSLRRGDYLVLVALGAQQQVPCGATLELLLHTEQQEYAGPDGAAPERRGDRLHFPVPGAAVLRS